MTECSRSSGKSSIGPAPLSAALLTTRVELAGGVERGAHRVGIGHVEREALRDVEVVEQARVARGRDDLVAAPRALDRRGPADGPARAGHQNSHRRKLQPDAGVTAATADSDRALRGVGAGASPRGTRVTTLCSDRRVIERAAGGMRGDRALEAAQDLGVGRIGLPPLPHRSLVRFTGHAS